MAERSGIDKASLSRLENGWYPNPTVNTLARTLERSASDWSWSWGIDSGSTRAPAPATAASHARHRSASSLPRAWLARPSGPASRTINLAAVSIALGRADGGRSLVDAPEDVRPDLICIRLVGHVGNLGERVRERLGSGLLLLVRQRPGSSRGCIDRVGGGDSDHGGTLLLCKNGRRSRSIPGRVILADQRFPLEGLATGCATLHVQRQSERDVLPTDVTLSSASGRGGLRYNQEARSPMTAFLTSAGLPSMRSPFPGMDPYIESFGLWEDFHSKLIGEMERSLSSLVPDRYVVRTGKRAYVAIGGPGGDEGHEILPDVALAAASGPEAVASAAAAGPEGGESEGAPVLMQALFESEYREVFLEIHQTEPERRLVTGIELLSPSKSAPAPRAGACMTANARSTFAAWRTS